MPRQLDASFVTEVVILLAWALTTWYVYFTFKESGHAKAKTISLTLGVLAWSIFAFGAVKYGIDREFFRGLPVRPLVYLFLAAGLGYAFRWALVGKGLSQHMLISMQLLRPIGLVFVLVHWRGNLPGVFAHPAGWGGPTRRHHRPSCAHPLPKPGNPEWCCQTPFHRRNN